MGQTQPLKVQLETGHPRASALCLRVFLIIGEHTQRSNRPKKRTMSTGTAPLHTRTGGAGSGALLAANGLPGSRRYLAGWRPACWPEGWLAASWLAASWLAAAMRADVR